MNTICENVAVVADVAPNGMLLVRGPSWPSQWKSEPVNESDVIWLDETTPTGAH